MLKMSNVVVTAIILGTLVVTVHITFMILGYHGVGPEIASHSLRDILLDGSLLSVWKDIRALNLEQDK